MHRRQTAENRAAVLSIVTNDDTGLKQARAMGVGNGDTTMETRTPSFARAFIGFLTSVSLTTTLMLALSATP
jgi:hypothetical protein